MGASKLPENEMQDSMSSSTVNINQLLENSDKLWHTYDVNEEVVRTKEFGGHTEDLLREAKRNHRTDISSKSWNKYCYAEKWESIKKELTYGCPQNIQRIHANQYSIHEFHEKFERTHVPVLIQGLADDWPARKSWSLADLREKYGECLFKCGEDDDGYPIRVKLKHFLRYQNSEAVGGAKSDDSPLYIFDSRFDDHNSTRDLLNDYTVPHLFCEDLFHMVGDSRRPPHRWILFGPTRSGSGVHIDPLGTSAWNTLIRGHKLWTLFPPDVSRATVKGREHVRWKEEDDEPIDWQVNILPRILEKGGESLKNKMIQFIQKPGETVFVPSDWWHGVLNLDTTVAVTQNFCSSGNFEAVWRQTRSGRKKMARSWLAKLSVERPDLAAIAVELNRQDRYDMDEEIRMEHERKLKKKEAKAKRKEANND